MADQIEKARNIKNKFEKDWLAIDGVVAIGIGTTADGRIGLIVSVKEASDKFRAQIPEQIDGVSIEIQETGEIRAL